MLAGYSYRRKAVGVACKRENAYYSILYILLHDNVRIMPVLLAYVN